MLSSIEIAYYDEENRTTIVLVKSQTHHSLNKSISQTTFDMNIGGISVFYYLDFN